MPSLKIMASVLMVVDMRKLFIIILMISQLTGLSAYSGIHTTHDARMAWWRKARFGMFIHWGLYAIPAGEWRGKIIPGVGEWIMAHAQIPVDQYEPLKKKFNPVNFNAERWVKLAKQAGVKYIVITTKHHDGFCLFDSKYTDYDIMSTPFKRDIMKELSDACHRNGIKIGWYYSIMDWHHPDYLPRHKWDKRPADNASYDRYIKYVKNQLTGLLTNYGKISILWFDGGWEHKASEHHAAEIIALARKLQSDIIINDRLGIPEDFGTPEQEIPATGIPGRDWETCMTMNDTWGYKKSDNNWKSSQDLIRKLIEIASNGGNYLLNVGPTALGEIPEPSVERLKAIGHWLKINGESIYGTKASPFPKLPWGRCTQKEFHSGKTRLYFHVFRWPEDGKLVVPGLKNRVKSTYLLGDPKRKKLRITRKKESIVINVPPQPLDKAVTVVEVDIVGG